jgi:pyruvate,water dikinase
MPAFWSIFDFFSQKRQEKLLKGDDEKALFVKKYKAFRQVLESNNDVLLAMGDMQEKTHGGYVFDRVYIQSSYDAISQEVKEIIDNLNTLADGKYRDLIIAYQQIDAAIRTQLSGRVTIPETDYVLSLQALDKDRVPEAGGKFAYLGELRNSLGAPVPAGFVITTFAYKIFAQHNRIEDLLKKRTQDFHSSKYEEVESVCREVQDLVRAGEIPPELQDALVKAYETLKEEVGREEELMVAVRSSAIHEDVLASFAGQYETELNVPGNAILGQYKAVLASQFTPRAVFYYMDKGFAVEEMAMAVGVLAMVQARSSGVVYSRDPTNPREDIVLITAVWGLGSYAVEGRVSATNYRVRGDNGKRIICEGTGRQEVMLVGNPGSGTREMAVPEELREEACLSNDEIYLLARHAREAESHFGQPQDMEWAVDQENQIYLLQSRPLRLPMLKPAADPERQRVARGHQILIDRGTIACPGAAAGKVFVAIKVEDLNSFPEGGVLVIRHTHPEFATILKKAAAVVSDIGTTLGHLATVAREYSVPAIFNTGNATRILKNGMNVTVDAVYGNIYEGIVKEVLRETRMESAFQNSPVMKQLRKILEKITPLNLTDPRGPDFMPSKCRTLHDITRFSHEMALRSIFRLSKESHFAERSAKQLVSEVPLQWWVIDLEDGISKHVKGKRVKVEDIVSIPMKALWKGMTAVPWKGPPPVDAKGFMSVMFSATTDPSIDPAVGLKFAERNYILIARNFCNVSTRLGFHFSTIEAYLGEEENLNYISFVYTGGGADSGRKGRRADLISRLLETCDFRVEKKGDTIFARMEGHKQEFLEKRLNVLGHIIVHTRQMDMVMFNDAMVDYYYAEIWKGIESFTEL